MAQESPAVILYDANSKPLAVKDGVAIPADTPGLLPLAKLASDGKSYYLEVEDYSGRKRLLTQAIIRGATSGFDADVTAQKRLRVDPSNGAGLGEVNEYLTFSSNPDMNYNGSGTPRVYSYSAGSDDIELISMVLSVEEPTISFGTTFWGISGLTNGLLFELKSQGVSYTICNPRYTRDCVEEADSGGFDLVAASPDYARIRRSFAPGVVLKKQGTYPGNEDYIRATVRDNISGLDYLRVKIRGVKV